MNAVGLWLVKSQTIGTGVSSVTVTGAFSTDYDTYRIVINGCTYSVLDTTLSCRPGGISTASYFGGGFFQQYGGATLTALNLSGGTSGAVGITSTIPMSNIFDIADPFISGRQKRMMGMFSLGGNFLAQYCSVLTATGSYTDLTILPASGTMTGGTIAVYGYKK
jgi:hypothetical protein